MKKEAIIAIVFGVILGLLLAVVLIVNLRRAEPKKTDSIAGAKISPTPKGIGNTKPLEIKQPPDGAITSKNSITIKGKTNKGDLVVIQSPVKDVAFKNAKEDFSIDFPLVLGENVISVFAYSQKTQTTPQVKTLKVYFLDEI